MTWRVIEDNGRWFVRVENADTTHYPWSTKEAAEAYARARNQGQPHYIAVSRGLQHGVFAK